MQKFMILAATGLTLAGAGAAVVAPVLSTSAFAQSTATQGVAVQDGAQTAPVPGQPGSGPRGPMGRGPGGFGPGGPGQGGPGQAGPGPMADRDGGWWHHPHHQMGQEGRGMEGRGPMGGLFGLFHHQDDKQLTSAEAQKIAEAFLLWQGNRTWKVTELKQDGDKISFAYATQSGDVIARFAMDRKTGRVHRTG